MSEGFSRRSAAIGVAAMLLLAGCTSQPTERPTTPASATVAAAEQTPTPTGAPAPAYSPTPSPTPKVVPARREWRSPPDLVFDGDCSALFSAKEISDLLAQPVAKPDSVSAPLDLIRALPTYAVVQHNGGIQCRWHNDPDTDGRGVKNPWLTMTVLPAAAAPDTRLGSDCAGRENQGCFVTLGANGYVAFAQLNTTVDDATALANLGRVFAAKTAMAGPPPAAWSRQKGDWPASIDCSALFDDADIEKALGQGSFTVDDAYVDESVPALTALAGSGGESGCGGTSEHEYEKGYISHIGVTLLSGGAWLKKTVLALPDARYVTVAGADSAIVVPMNFGEGPSSTFYVFSGTNVLTVGADTSVQAMYPVIPGLIAALDRL